MVSRIAKVINTISKNLNRYLNTFLLTFLNARYSKKQIREYPNTNIEIMKLSLIIFSHNMVGEMKAKDLLKQKSKLPKLP